MSKGIETIAGPNWDSVEPKPEPVKPPEKTEEEFETEALNTRKRAAFEFWNKLREDTNGDLEKEREKLEAIKNEKRKKSKKKAIGILESRFEDAEKGLNFLSEDNIVQAEDLLCEKMNEHSESFKKGHVKKEFAPIDEKFLKYVAGVVESGTALRENQTKTFGRYLEIIGEKPGKKLEAEKLKEKIEALESKSKPAEKPAKADSAEPIKEEHTTEYVAQGNLDLDFDPIIVGAGETVDQKFGETQIVSTSDAVVNFEPEKPIDKWNELVANQKEIIKKISTGELSKEDGERQKKEASWEIIKQGCEITGENFEAAQADIKTREEDQWQTSILSQFPNFSGDINAYKEWQGRIFANDKKAVATWCEGVIRGQNNLSSEQKTSLLEKGEIGIGSRIVLEKEDAAVLLKSGIDITKAKRKVGKWYKLWYPWGTTVDFTIGEKHFDNINHLNNFIAEEKERHIKEEFEKKYNDRKKEDTDRSIEQYVLEQKAKELHDSFPKQEISEESKKLTEYFGGGLENEEQKKKTLEIFQNQEEECRKLAKKLEEKIDNPKHAKTKEATTKRLEALLGKHKALARAMIELAGSILGEDIREKAREKVEGDESQKNAPNKSQLIGKAVYEIIKNIVK